MTASVCVCVCPTLFLRVSTPKKNLQAGACDTLALPHATKLWAREGAGPDQPCVPAVLPSCDSILPLVCFHGGFHATLP